MTIEQIEKSKQRMKEELPKLKRDYEKIHDIITLIDKYIENGSLENFEEYSLQLNSIADSLEVIEM